MDLLLKEEVENMKSECFSTARSKDHLQARERERESERERECVCERERARERERVCVCENIMCEENAAVSSRVSPLFSLFVFLIDSRLTHASL